MSTWIDCPEQAPEPGCYWERWKNNPGQARPFRLRVAGRAVRADGFLDSVPWEDFRILRQMWPIPITEPGAAPTPEPLFRSTEQELRAWAADAERAHRDTSQPWPRGYRCAVSDALFILDGGMGTSASDEPDPEAADLHDLIAETVLETGDAEDSELADSIASNLVPAIRRWAAGEVHRWVDSKRSEPDSEDVAEANGDSACGDAEIRQRISRLEEWVPAHERRTARRLDDHVDRFEKLEARVSEVEEDCSVLDKDCAALSRRIDRLETAAKAHVEELGSLDRRIRGLERRFERAEQARAEQQAATAAGEPEPAPTEACEQCGQVPVVCHDCGAWSCSCERDMEPCPSCGTRRCTNCGAEI